MLPVIIDGECMNKNTLKGTVKQVKGAAQSAIGGATNDRSTQLKGEANKIAGKAQRAVGKMEDDLD